MGTLKALRRPRRSALVRRSLFFGMTLLTALGAGAVMHDILGVNGTTPLEWLSLLLFFGLFAWIAGAFWTALAGFVVRLRGRDTALIQMTEAQAATPVRSRTAIVMPIYNEELRRVGAGIEAVWRSLSRQAECAAFDFFILSDTRDAGQVAAEEGLWRTLVARNAASGQIFYRNRRERQGRKAGNIADFVRGWGAAYDYMIVLDADSVMTGHTLVTLARLMDAHPEVGILQTMPVPTGRETLFARLLQFAARLNGPMLASGLAFWHLGESSYWGHNAIIRVRAFADFCCLPRLSGAEPLGGDILSHDFVEAAFMRAAGYRVWLLPELEGSWEEMPSNTIDYAARDRRWTQGNLQHLRLLSLPGLHWLSRTHLFGGVLSYVTAPMWFVVLIIASALAYIAQRPQYFQPGQHALFPQWPQWRTGEIAVLLTLTIVVLLLPKVMGAILALVDPRLRRAFGGARRIGLSLLLEQIFSMLLAPPMMVFHSMFVLQTLAGGRTSWSGQERADRGIGFAEALARYKWHTLLGIVWTLIVVLWTPGFFWWMLPVFAGLLLSIPVAMLTSRADLGRRARCWRLFLTPEESSPPRELVALKDFSLPRAPPAVEESAVPVRMPLPMRPFFRDGRFVSHSSVEL